ncbi:hypothetical protein BJ742DRAFT_293883 [Cladochytrium replicatum]|nr:hypothetical protein BJ742DRAFT_293883 [Cladochytrium replicatum]
MLTLQNCHITKCSLSVYLVIVIASASALLLGYLAVNAFGDNDLLKHRPTIKRLDNGKLGFHRDMVCQCRLNSVESWRACSVDRTLSMRGRTVCITNSGKTVQARVVNLCPSCVSGKLDAPPPGSWKGGDRYLVGIFCNGSVSSSPAASAVAGSSATNYDDDCTRNIGGCPFRNNNDDGNNDDGNNYELLVIERPSLCRRRMCLELDH